MNDIVVVGHQPQLMPYIGILNKISKADIFIIVDHVQYVRRYFYNRTYIKLNDRKQLLTVPVLSKGEYYSPINMIKINNKEMWIRKHLKTIQIAYAKAKYFSSYYDKVEEIYLKRHEYLSEFTSELLIFFLKEFELVNDIRFSSNMQLSCNKTELLIELINAVGGNIYISGEGAREYFDEELFNKSGYKHLFNKFYHPVYPQLGKSVIEGMGCIDLLFNCGKDGRRYIVNR